ncbi:pilus assembly PilX N-terminal domain-containing protein [Patescibacteria group bacterium]|nr:pilus assembly PilX N-terminal domain-containing protein [Patescibacteria group bacterium]
MRDNILPKTQCSDERGSTLALSIVILAGVMGISLAIGAITVKELKTTSNETISATAFFAADAGMERAIYEHNVNNKRSGTFTRTLGNNARFSATLSKKQSQSGELHQDEPHEYSLPSGSAKEITLTWERSQNPDYNTGIVAPSMLYKLVSFGPGGSIQEKNIVEKEGLCDPTCGSNGWKIPIDPSKDSIFRIKPVDNGAQYSITISDGTGTLDVIVVESTGIYNEAKRAERTELSENEPVMGLWDYVLVSGTNL